MSAAVTTEDHGFEIVGPRSAGSNPGVAVNVSERS
jgi:hypothetical protein